MGLLTRVLSIYPRLILAFLIVIVPIYVISLKMNEYGEKNVRKEIENSMQSRVHFYIGLLENEFTRIIRMQDQYVNDRDLRTLSIANAIISDNDRRNAIINLQSRMITMKNSSIYIANIGAYLPSEQRLISTNILYDRLPEEEYEALKVVKNRFENPFVYWQDRLFISFPYSQLALLNGRDPQFLIGVEISLNQVREVLNRFEMSGNGGSSIVGRDGSWVISSDRGAQEIPAMDSFLKNRSVDGQASVQVANIAGQSTWLSYEESTEFGFKLIMYAPESEMIGSLTQFRTWFWMLSIISGLVVGLFSYWIFLQIHQPMKRLVRAFQQVEQGNLDVALEYKRNDEFRYLYRRFNVMVRKISELIHEVYEQKFRANLSQLRQLQSQINPHFLYNSFFILYRMAKNEENENISRFTHYLGEYFQFITKTHQDEVFLEDEVKYARTYVDIQTFRFEDRISVRFEALPEQYTAIKVPKLILQPIIENAYVHGLRDKLREGQLDIRFERHGNDLIISVEDNGTGLTEREFEQLLRKLNLLGEDIETTGLVNVHRRLKLKYGGTSGIIISNLPGERFMVQLIIPIIP